MCVFDNCRNARGHGYPDSWQEHVIERSLRRWRRPSLDKPWVCIHMFRKSDAIYRTSNRCGRAASKTLQWLFGLAKINRLAATATKLSLSSFVRSSGPTDQEIDILEKWIERPRWKFAEPREIFSSRIGERRT